MSESIIWDTLIKTQDEILDIFNEFGNEIEEKGLNKFNSMAVSTRNAGYPCGACRQVIWELCGDITVYICNSKELVKELKSSDLLPNPFNKSLAKRSA